MRFPAFLSTFAAALCLLLSVWFISVSFVDQGLQSDLQKKQTELQAQQQKLQFQQQLLQSAQQQINNTNTTTQKVAEILGDMRALAVQNKNDKLKNLLIKYGINPDEPSAEAKAAPAAAAPAASSSAAPALTKPSTTK
jgi:hypothetical protein